MNKSKKPLAMLSTAAVAGLIVAAVTTPVSAKTTALVVNTKDAKTYEYNYAALRTSATSYILNGANDTGAKLYNHFITNKSSMNSFYDDVKAGYVDAKVVSAAAVDAAINKKTFVLDTFTSATTTATTPVTATKVNNDGTVSADQATVSSVSAINKTKVTVTFSAAVDSIKAANFTIEGASVTAASLSEDKKTATLEVTGLDYAKSYTVVASDVLVGGKTAPSSSKAFTTPAVTDLWNLDVTPTSSSLVADGADNTEVTFRLINKVTGAVDTNADNMVLDLNATFGSLASKRVTIQDGQAKVLLTSEFSNTVVSAKIDAQIIEASGDYKDLIGKVIGTKAINFVTSDVNAIDAVNVVSAESNQADRVTLFFDKAVSLATFASTNAKGELLYNIDGGAQGITKSEIPAGTTASAIHYKYKLTDGIKVSQVTGDNIKVQGIRLVAGNTKAVEVILDKTTPLIDNKTVNVAVKTVNSLDKTTSSDTTFKLTDARQPEVTSIAAEGLNTLKVKFSEAVKDAAFKIDGQFGPTTFVATYGEFNQATLEDNRDVATLVLNGTYDEDGGVTPSTTLAGFFTAGSHSLQISSTRDFAALTDATNTGTTQNLTFAVVADTSKPVATVSVESPEQFRVTFNKPISILNSKTLDQVAVLQVYDDATKTYVGLNALTAVKALPALTVDKISDSEYVLELDKDWTQVFGTKASRNNYYNYKFRLEIAADAVANIVNGATNTLADLDLNYTGSALNTPDTTSATIKSIDQVGTTDSFVVSMDEPVKLLGVITGLDTNPTLNEDQTALPKTSVQFIGKDKDGKTVTVDGTVGGYADENRADKKFTVSAGLQTLVDGQGYGQDWTVVVKSLSDDVGNTVATATKAFSVTKSATADSKFQIAQPTPTTYNVVGNLNGTAADTLKITFTEGVLHKGEASDATNPAQYTLNGKTLPVGTDIVVSDADANTVNGLEVVTITLPTGTLLDTSNVVTVNKNLVSYDGTVLTGEYQVDFIVADGSAATLQAAKTALETSITAAQAKLVSNTTGAGVGNVPAGSTAALTAAIAAATTVDTTVASTDSDFTAAKTTLDAAVVTFNGTIIAAGNSTALNTEIGTATALLGTVNVVAVPTATGDVTQADYDTLNAAITAAQTAYAARATMTQAQLDAATLALTTAQGTFTAAIHA